MFDRITELATRHGAAMLSAERYIWAHPETGFREWTVNNYLAGKFEEAGLAVTRAGDIPGFYADIAGGRPGPLVAVLGELDALPVEDHPERDPSTNAVHACGHNCQAAALLGVALILSEPEVRRELCGTVRLAAVPAEEFADMDYRTALRDRGVIRYADGKTEMLRRGWFDGAAMCFYIHTDPVQSEKPRLIMCRGTVGAALKRVTYTAKPGLFPGERVNPFYAATVGIGAHGIVREKHSGDGTFTTRVMLRRGGEAVNVVPRSVVLESDVRTADGDELRMANGQTDRAFAAGALAAGCEVSVRGIGCYLPHYNCEGLNEEFAKTVLAVPGVELVRQTTHNLGSSDFANLSAVVPTTWCYINGASGAPHSRDYRVSRPEWAVVESARVQAIFISEMLKDGAARLLAAVKGYKPPFSSKEALFAALDGFLAERRLVEYSGDGARVNC